MDKSFHYKVEGLVDINFNSFKSFSGTYFNSLGKKRELKIFILQRLYFQTPPRAHDHGLIMTSEFGLFRNKVSFCDF